MGHEEDNLHKHENTLVKRNCVTGRLKESAILESGTNSGPTVWMQWSQDSRAAMPLHQARQTRFFNNAKRVKAGSIATQFSVSSRGRMIKEEDT